MLVYQCEDSLEGVFTGIYTAYEQKRNPADTMLSLDGELYLFAEYQSVLPDKDKTIKVIRTLRKRFGEEDYHHICLALSTPEPAKAQAVYQTVCAGLSAGAKSYGHLFDNLANDYVNQAFSLSRGAGNENCHLRGFVRFQELDNGVLFSKICPKNNLLTFLMEHFADRFPVENFVLYDANRNLFGIHPAQKQWYLLSNTEVLENTGKLRLSAKELEYQELFRYFCHKIAIMDRENLNLQRNMLPLLFREYMVEFCR